MSRYYDEDDGVYDEYAEDEDYYGDAIDDDEDVISFDDMPLEDGMDDLDNCNPPPEEWRSMKVGESIVDVSSYGRIKYDANRTPFVASTEGLPCVGTPYRLCPLQVDNRSMNVFVHELVWRAFRGEPPKDWSIRHVSKPQKDGYYSNALKNLTVLPTTVSPWPANPYKDNATNSVKNEA
jgi:hypothetical protein